jgi:hypothetical protein
MIDGLEGGKFFFGKSLDHKGFRENSSTTNQEVRALARIIHEV